MPSETPTNVAPARVRRIDLAHVNGKNDTSCSALARECLCSVARPYASASVFAEKYPVHASWNDGGIAFLQGRRQQIVGDALKRHRAEPSFDRRCAYGSTGA